jgi:hypothetical protein
MKKTVLFFLSLCITMMLQASITKTVNVAVAGTFSSTMTRLELNTVGKLTISGYMNANDFDSLNTFGYQLDTLDISAVTVTNNILPNYAFSFNSLSTIILPSNLVSTGDYTFENCYYLQSITYPSTLTTFGTGLFENCFGLTSVTIPSTVTSIGDYCFYECNNLSSVTIPTSVTTIGEYLFDHCTSLTSVTIPSSVTALGVGAFFQCEALKSVSLSSSLSTLPTNTFFGCLALTSYTVPSTISVIDAMAFSTCTNLTSITIPTSVTTIESSAFEFCTSLTAIAIPSSVTSIGYHAFNGCSTLKTITIPSSVSIIEGYTFENCSGLTKVSIPSTITSINYGAFDGCTSLQSLTIPSSVKTIESNVFNNCSGLTSIVAFQATPISLSLSTGVFTNVDKNNCYLFVPSGSKGSYSLASQWKDFKHIVEFDVSQLTGTTDLSVSKSAVTLTNNIASVQIISNTLWSATSNQSWLTINPVTGIVNDTLSFIATNNTTNAPRTATVTIKTETSTKTITIKQKAMSVIIWPNPVAVLDSTHLSSIQLNATANTPGVFTYTPNVGTQLYTGTNQLLLVTFTPSDTSSFELVSKTDTITVIEPVVTLSTQNSSITAINGSSTITISSNTTWTAVGNQQWLTVTPNGNNSITVTALDNTTNIARTATIIISAAGLKNQTIVISQAAGTGGTYTEINSNDFMLYPNPARDHFSILTDENVLVKIYSVNSTLVLTTQTSGKELISINGLSTGLYIAKIITSKGVITRHLVVE